MSKSIAVLLALILITTSLFGCSTAQYAATTEPTVLSDNASSTAPSFTPPPIDFDIQEPTVSITSNSTFEIHFIDVGQADAALILCDEEAMLIDGGNVADSSKLYTYLKNHDISYLDYVIGTHAHEDHIGGIAGALNYATAGVVYCPVTSYSTDAFDNFSKAVQKCGISITVPTVGTVFSLGSARCEILAVNTTSDTNNSSIVLRITYGDTSFLFTGDAERETEQYILDNNSNLKSSVLKVGHHGSDSSTGYVWLRETMPEYAIISVGSDNSYGHPTEAVLSRLRDADVKTYRTDLQGDIICTSDGKTVSVTVSRNKNADVFGGIGANSTQSPTEPEDNNAPSTYYILNTNSKKFHYPTCHSAAKISDKNRKDFHGTREELIQSGYSPCGNCDP